MIKIPEEIEFEENPEEPEEETKETPQYMMEGFFDYKNLMINPEARKVYEQITRDMQLGNLKKEDYKMVFMHFHMAMECSRFEELRDAGDFFFQRGLTHIIMSNSTEGFLRRMEATSIRIQQKQEEKKEGGWLKWKK